MICASIGVKISFIPYKICFNVTFLLQKTFVNQSDVFATRECCAFLYSSSKSTLNLAFYLLQDKNGSVFGQKMELFPRFVQKFFLCPYNFSKNRKENLEIGLKYP